MTQLSHGVWVWPALGSVETLTLDPACARQEDVTIWLQVVRTQALTGAAGTLQCWTDAPTHEDEIDKRCWKAYDVACWPPQDTQKWMSLPIVLSPRVSDRAVQRGAPLEVRYTWRFKLPNDQVEWLGAPGQDALVRLVTMEDIKEILRLYDAFSETGRGPDGVTTIRIGHSSGRRTALCEVLVPCRGVVIERTKSTWHTSRSFGTIEALSCVHLASLIVLSFEGGRVVVLLPTCGEGATVKLARSTFNTQTVDVDVDGEGPGAVIVGRGYERQLGGLLRSCHKAARDFLGGLDEVTTDADGPLSLQSGLGFCTWEALGNGTPAKLSTLMHTLDAFEGPLEGGIATLLIDDGWQHISPTNTYTPVDASRTLVSFDLGPHLLDDEEMSEFVKDSLPCPRLARYIDRLRRRYRHIQQIGVWMTLSGYWDGLDPDPDGFFARRYGPLRRCKISDALASGPRASREIQLPHANRLDSFWRDCFTAYRSAGVNFVKVDAQSELDWVVDEKGYFDLAWTSLNRAASDVFGPESVIHCMAFGSRLVCGPLSYQSPNRLHLRNSDDTFPQVQEAHTWHLYHNALNSLLTSTHPTIIPDADMLMSKMTGELDWAAFHAAFRAVFSSAKLWISDAPCDSSRKTLGALLALGPSKAGPVIKTVQVGIGVKDAIRSTPLSSSIFSDCVEGPPLIMAARWQDSSGRPTAIISAWNVRSSLRWAYGPLTLTDVAEALDELDEHQHAYMLHSRARRCIEVISATELEKERLNPQIASRPLSGGCFSLPPASWEMVNVVPVLICSLKSSRGADIRIMIGCLGLMEKHAGLACVVDVKQQGPSSFVASLCRAGRCAFAILCEPHHDLHVRMQLDGGEEVAATVEDDFRSDFTVVSFDMLPYVRMNVDGPDQDAWKVRLHLEAL